MSTINGVPVPEPTVHSGKPYNGMGLFHGPNELRDVLIDRTSIEWVASYLDQCTWDGPTRTITPNHTFAFRQMSQRISGLVTQMGCKLADPDSRKNGPRFSVKSLRA